jgi:NADH-quinone oxidoreductase subunit J
LLNTILFWVLSVIGIASGIGLITHRSAVYSVLFAVLNFFCIAGLYLTLQAEFLAITQIIVYAGAIMVLFLFVVMLLNLGDDLTGAKFNATKGITFLIGFAFFAELIVIFKSFTDQSPLHLNNPYSYGTVEVIGKTLMNDYLFPFELVSVILLAALMGAMVIAKKHN